MRTLIYLLQLGAALTAPLVCAPQVCAQAKRIPGSGPPQPRTFLTVGDTITVSATPATLNITLVPGATATAGTAIAISSSWSGISLLSSVSLWASFGSSTAALSGGTPVSYIPSSAILGMDPSGIPTSFTAFTGTTPLGAAGALQLYSTASILSLSGGHSDSLWLQVNLASLPQLPAAIYTGTISFVAQAF